MLKILGAGAFCVIFVVMLIVSIAHSVLLLGFLLAIFVIALILRPLLFVGTSFVSLGNEKRFNAVMEKHVPLVSKREQYLKSYMLSNNNLDSQINQNINTININNIEDMILNDNDQFSVYIENINLNADLIKSFYFNRDEYISTNNLLEPFSKAIVGLIAIYLIIPFIDLKNTLYNNNLTEDNDEYLVSTLLRDFIIATDDSLIIIIMIKELAYSIVIDIDHVILFKDVMFILKSYSQNHVSNDFYRNRITETADETRNVGRSLMLKVKASFIHYYQYLLNNCDCISEDISIDQKISLAHDFIKQDREVIQIANLFNKFLSKYIEASAIAISLAKR